MGVHPDFVRFQGNGFDLLPDWLGCLLIIFACLKLSACSRFFVLTGWLGVANLVLQPVIYLYLVFPPSLITNEGILPPLTLSYLLNGLSSLLMLVMFYGICRGLLEWAERPENRKSRPLLTASIHNRWKLAFVMIVPYLFALPFGYNLPEDFALFLIVWGVINWLIWLILIHLLFKASKLLAEPLEPSDSDGALQRIDLTV